MSFKEVSSLDADVTVALGKKDKKTGKPYPKQAEGYYLGSRSVKGGRGQNSNIHFLQTEAGNLGVWGTTDLDRKLGGVAPGTMIRITSTGIKPTPNGDMYTYKVEVDVDNTIEVSTQSDSYAGSSDNNDDTSDDDSNGVDDEELQVAAELAAADRKAKVEALLKGGKNKTAKN